MPLAFRPQSLEMTHMSEAEFNNLSNLSGYLQTRRSGRPRNLIEPGPSDTQLRDIVRVAMRTPDHGKLAPWRVVAVASDQRDNLADGLKAAYLREKPDAGRSELEAMDNMAREAPALLTVLSSPVESSKIPVWEQELSCGAFCMNLIHAIHAENFLGGWITGWPAFNEDVRDMFGKAPEKIAGFIFAGSTGAPLKERPRPQLDEIFSQWSPPQTD